MKLQFPTVSGLILLIALATWGCDVTTTTVPDTSSPEITITYPANWSTVYETELTAHLEVEDEHPVDTLWVYVNGELSETLTSEPYQLLLHQADYPAGVITLHAEAIDSKGNRGMSRVQNFYWLPESQQSNITITMPRPVVWEKFTTSQVPVVVDIESAQPLSSVELYVDGVPFYLFTDAPYETTLTIEEQGTHNIYARVTDSLGTTQCGELITFEVILEDVESPTGFITFPSDWADVTGVFDVRVTAVDNGVIDRVELYIDGLETQEMFSAPYHFSVDAASLSLGTHTIFARIWDSAQNDGITQMVTVRVIE
jgi:hypothetical protein